MKEIYNAVFVDSKRGTWIIPEVFESKYSIIGEVKEEGKLKKIDFKSISFTDMVSVEFTDGEAYRIASFHYDYDQYYQAYKAGIKIMTRWEICGKKEKRYYIYGVVEGRKVQGIVKQQFDNYIMLESGEIYFIKWNDTFFRYEEQIYILKKMSDLIPENGELEPWGGINIKPHIIL